MDRLIKVLCKAKCISGCCLESPCASSSRTAPANVLMLCPFCVHSNSACRRSKAPVTCSTAEPLVQQLLTLPDKYTAQKAQRQRKQSAEQMMNMSGRNDEHVWPTCQSKAGGQVNTKSKDFIGPGNIDAKAVRNEAMP